MCGITGIFDTRGKRDIDRAVLHRMNESQFHRGPDEGGLHIEPGVGLGHRRLSIIDLSTGQHRRNQTGRQHAVGNASLERCRQRVFFINMHRIGVARDAREHQNVRLGNSLGERGRHAHLQVFNVVAVLLIHISCPKIELPNKKSPK